MRKLREGESVLPLDNMVVVHAEGWEDIKRPNWAFAIKGK